jgi:uncharacterized phage-like protein YoqJ
MVRCGTALSVASDGIFTRRNMTNVAITGHRPDKIPDGKWVYDRLLEAFEDLGAFRVIQGMAPGVDLLSAHAAYDAGLPFVCAKPYPSHRRYVEKNYPDWTMNYDSALEKADEVVDVCKTYEGVWVFQRRNEWMVDHADTVIAVWDGTKGGTANCVKYANRKRKPVYLIDPATPEVHGLL